METKARAQGDLWALADATIGAEASDGVTGCVGKKMRTAWGWGGGEAPGI